MDCTGAGRPTDVVSFGRQRRRSRKDGCFGARLVAAGRRVCSSSPAAPDGVDGSGVRQARARSRPTSHMVLVSLFAATHLFGSQRSVLLWCLADLGATDACLGSLRWGFGNDGGQWRATMWGCAGTLRAFFVFLLFLGSFLHLFWTPVFFWDLRASAACVLYLSI